jgi:alpha-N-arabinofuranosidase
MIYGHFIEHFHRQIYGGIFDPGNRLSDEDGFRRDVIDAMKKIKVPVLRWPGGCFVSAHHWKDAVGGERKPSFDKAWRVEEPNLFGTDEYIAFCRKVGCEPYICTNAGTGTAEEMSDWVEYCNLNDEGFYAKWRIANGHREPYGVKYWSIGNENYGNWEIGAKSSGEWGRLVTEAAKMIKRVDPVVELSAAALADLDWNINILRNCGDRLNWISIHDYWDAIQQTNDYADYEQCMAYTNHLEDKVSRIRGLLYAMDFYKKIRITFDEWNLRGWYHPNIHTVNQALNRAEYITPRDLNDENRRYTMADAVFTACFLNMCNRNCDIIGMANFAPVVNTRGCIFTYRDGIVLRPTWHVFDLRNYIITYT